MVNPTVPIWAQEIPGNFLTSALWNQNIYNNGTFLTNPPAFIGDQITTQSIPNGGTATPLAIDNGTFDPYGGHSNTVNNTRYTCQIGAQGYYFVIGSCGLAANATGNRVVQINKNGTNVPLGVVSGLAPAVANGSVQQVGALVQLSAGDYIEIAGYQNSGGALNTSTASTGMTLWFVHA